MPEFARYLIALGLAVLAVVLYVFLLRFPTQDKLDALIVQHGQKQAVLREKKQIADELQTWQIEVQKLEVLLKEALLQLPAEVDTDQLLITIPNIAKKNALQVDLFELKGEQKRTGYAEIPMQLKMQGSYRGIGSFAQEIGDQPRIMAVTALKLARSQAKGAAQTQVNVKDGTAADEVADSGVRLAIEAQVVTYRFLEDGGAKKAPPAKAQGRR